MPTLEQLEQAADSLGLPNSRKGASLRVHIDFQSTLLAGVVLRIRSNSSRTTASIWWGQSQAGTSPCWSWARSSGWVHAPPFIRLTTPRNWFP